MFRIRISVYTYLGLLLSSVRLLPCFSSLLQQISVDASPAPGCLLRRHRYVGSVLADGDGQRSAGLSLPCLNPLGVLASSSSCSRRSLPPPDDVHCIYELHDDGPAPPADTSLCGGNTVDDRVSTCYVAKRVRVTGNRPAYSL